MVTGVQTCALPISILDGIACREHQYRRTIAARTQLGQQLQAIAVGQSQIEDRRIVTCHRKSFPSIRAPRYRIHHEARAAQGGPKDVTDPSFVFDDQEAHISPVIVRHRPRQSPAIRASPARQV